DPQPVVTSVYPAGDRVPANLLRFYIEFSHPMQRGDVRDNITLLDASGQPVEGPFLQIGHELWDPGMRRLTVLLDPGRIKLGVAPNRQVGAPLAADGSYQLLIGPGLRDAEGRPLAQIHRKSFTTTADDRKSPDPRRWQLSQPRRGTDTPLAVTLDGVIDPMLARRLVRVEDLGGTPIPGAVTVDEDAHALLFTPSQPWTADGYRLAIHPSLEDYAGNRVASLFDMKAGSVARLAETGATRSVVYLPIATAEPGR
ncbi:MAG: Ig-like domain-containing protein, partial [Myxococcota bacterium]